MEKNLMIVSLMLLKFCWMPNFLTLRDFKTLFGDITWILSQLLRANPQFKYYTQVCCILIFCVHELCPRPLALYGGSMSTLVDRGWGGGGVLDFFRALCPPFYLHIGRHSHNEICPASSIFTNCKAMVNGASLSEPHTSMTASNTCVYISMFVWTNHLP